MSNGTVARSQRTRHLPVKGYRGIYYSETSRGRTYEVRYRDSDGRDRFEAVGPRLEDAKHRLATVRVKLGQGERVAPSRKLFGDVVDEWKAQRHVKDRTASTYDILLDCHILPRFKNRRIQEITTDGIAAWLADLRPVRGKGELSGGTKALAFAVLHQVLDYAASPRRGYIAANPAAGLLKREKPKQEKLEHRLLAAYELGPLLEASTTWLRPMIRVALTTGMRVGEILALRWQDIDFERGVIHVRHTMGRQANLTTPKGKHARTIDLFASTRSVLAGLATLEAQPTDFVFSNRRGRPRMASEVQRAFRIARERACLSSIPRQLRFHDLRHTHASTLLNDGAKSIVFVSERLGHASIKITLDTYAHVIRSEEHAAAAEANLMQAFGDLLAA